MTDKIVVLATCGSVKEASRIARSLVERRLAACVNILEVPVLSIYRWKGKIESAKESLLLIKSSRKRFTAVESAIKQLHSYKLPEIIALPIERGSRGYLTWLGKSIRPPHLRRKNHT
jgi:periplasmic divalent cation tolerance protein